MIINLPAGAQVRYQADIYLLPHGILAKHKFGTEARQPGDVVRIYGVTVRT